MGVKYTKEDCIESLHEAEESLGKSPTWKEYNQLDISPNGDTIQNRFGNWNTAKEEAGLKIQRKRSGQITKEEVIKSIKSCNEDLGKVPSIDEFDEWSDEISSSTAGRLFENWSDAVSESGLHPLGYGNQIDKNYFDKINSQDKAYWLGFFLADGCVSSGSNRSWQFAISLKRQDKEHLRKFLEDCNSDHKIHDTDNGPNGGCYLHIGIQKFCNYLRDKGVRVRDKTIPQTPTEYKDDLIRGYFDGDGSVGYYHRENESDSFNWIIVAKNEDNIDKISESLGGVFWNGSLNKTTRREDREDKTTMYAVSTRSYKNIKKLYERLWNGDYRTVRCLSRKGKKMEEAVEASYPDREKKPKTKSIYEFV